MLLISTDMNILIIWLIATYVRSKDRRFDANCYYKNFGNTLTVRVRAYFLIIRVCLLLYKSGVPDSVLFVS